MVVYTALLYGAVGMSASREQAIAVTVANYLWPCLTLTLAVPVLGWSCRAWLLILGSTVAMVGVALSLAGGNADAGNHWSVRELLPVLAAAVAAVAWAAYSNLSRLWGGAGAGGAVPIFLLATGVGLASIRLGFREASAWSLTAIAQCAYMALMPTLLAYAFWDFGVRRGNLALIAAASYLTPVFSVWISSICWRLSLTRAQCAASVLVVAGAVLCRLAIQGASERVPRQASAHADRSGS
jgi:drug/metabolite transporter (DMT)-like permease